jgi:outer membrane protein TolC
VWSLVVPEQRQLDIHDPAQLPQVPIPQTPPPATVTNPAPPVAPRELSLDEAIRIALANSQVVRILAGTTAVASGQTIYDPAISNTAIDEQRAVFDPTVVVRNNFNRSEAPQALTDPTNPAGALITGARVDDYNLDASVQKRTVTGGTLSLDFVNDVSRFHPSFFNVLNPQDRSALTLSYTQPLLQGAGLAANLAPIVIARINTERSYFQFKDSVQEMVRGVIEAYWAVVFARTDVWARRQQVEQGEEAYNRAEARLRRGFGSLAEVAQAKVALSNFRANLIASEANLLQREAALRNILGLPPTVPERITLTSQPSSARLDPVWDEIVRLAEQRRPDIIELKLILEADRQALIQANNQALPRVDTTMLYRWNGLEGVTPGGARVASGPGQFTDWMLGVNFSVPLGLRQSRAGLRRAELVIARDRADLVQGVHAATHAVAGNVRNLAQFYEQYRAFRETRAAARDNLVQQLAEYRIGRAIFLNVLQAISDWGNAVSSEAQALAEYNTELANLERQTGTILETHGVYFVEERFRSIGPLGRLAEPRYYPSAVVPGPNADRYPLAPEPVEQTLDREKPTLSQPPLPGPPAERPAPTLPEPRPLPPPVRLGGT